MKILFCSQTRLAKELGGSKPLIELGEEMEVLGWRCDFLCPSDLAVVGEQARITRRSFEERLKTHLQQHAADYDVIDYDHGHLPFPRLAFAGDTLFVARSVLLAHHFERIDLPHSKRTLDRLRYLLRNRKHVGDRKRRTQAAHATVMEADLVNVPNEDDRTELIRCDVPPAKIVVIPFGISLHRRRLFEAVPEALPKSPVVAFVGTFDNRKGAVEFPEIVRRIIEAVPDVRFRLLGTSGVYPTEESVLAHFKKEYRRRIEVVPRFGPDALPDLLAACSVGVFPSYVEGFPFGVLEMTAAAVPVVAYDAPGAPMILPATQLAARGDVQSLCARITHLLGDRTALRNARAAARASSRQFCWQKIAEVTHHTYCARLQQRRGA